MKITKRIKKAISAVSAAAALIGCMAVSSLSASAGCNICYTCDTDAWVRTDPNSYVENRIGVIPQDSVIQVTETQDGWGRIEYSDIDTGETIIGWTDLGLYTPLILDDDYTFIDIPEDIRNSADKSLIYAYLAGEMNLNEAAADAAMVNIGCESAWNSSAYAIDTNGLPSMGLCQWNGARYESLLNFCNENGLNCNSVDAQMKYLQYEFETTYNRQYETLLDTENSADGCYEASYYWASKFEVCASRYWEGRAEQAYSYYLTNN